MPLSTESTEWFNTAINRVKGVVDMAKGKKKADKEPAVVGLRVTLTGARSLTVDGEAGTYKLVQDRRPITVTNEADMELFKTDTRCVCTAIHAPVRKKV